VGGISEKGKDTSFILPPKGGGLLRLSRAFSATLTGRIEDGYGEDECGRKVVGTYRLILTHPAFALSVI
jgi:hypothetical protein